MQQPLIQWNDGGQKSKGMCAASIKSESSNNVPSENWLVHKQTS